MLRSRSWAARRLTWEEYRQIEAKTPLLKPKVAGSCSAVKHLPIEERSAGNPRATFCDDVSFWSVASLRCAADLWSHWRYSEPRPDLPLANLVAHDPKLTSNVLYVRTGSGGSNW